MDINFNPEWYNLFIKHAEEKDIITSKLKKLFGNKTLQSCLEIGPGTSAFFAGQLSSIFRDYDIVEKENLELKLPDNAELIKADWELLSPKNKYDVILASHVLYYFKDKSKAIKKMFDSLKEEGRIYFIVNNTSEAYSDMKLHFANLMDAKYEFTHDNLISLLNKPFNKYVITSTVPFNAPEELYNIFKIVFDNYPEEYAKHKPEMLEFFKTLKSPFKLEQAIIEVSKD